MLSYLQSMTMPINEESKEIITNLLKSTIAITPEINVAKAWHTVEKEGLPVIYWHNGGTYGFSTFAGFLKDQNKAVIVVINQFNKNKISDGLGVAIMKELSK